MPPKKMPPKKAPPLSARGKGKAGGPPKGKSPKGKAGGPPKGKSPKGKAPPAPKGKSPKSRAAGPPSKSKSPKSKGQRPKSKGPPPKPKKESKVDKKLKKKYGTIMYDRTYLTSMRRDELEASAEKLREEVTLQRSERIRYQLERDFLYDLYTLYLARVRELELRLEAQTVENNRIVQDTEELSIVKGQEGKHFRYEILLKRSRMDMSDELRRKNLLNHADRIWQSACVTMDEQLDLADKRETEFLRKMTDTKEELNDLDQHLTNMKDQMKKFARDCVTQVSQSIRDCALITKMDSVEGEEVMNEMLFASGQLNDDMFEMIQNYYNDMTSNNLNVIIMMRDRYEELFDHNKFMKGEIERFEDGTYRANKIMKKLKPTYNRAKIRHDQTVRLEQGRLTTQKGIELCDTRLTQLTQIYNQLMKKLAVITDERTYFRNSTEELANGVINSYRSRYHLDELKDEMDKVIKKRDVEEESLLKFFEDPLHFYDEIDRHRSQLNRKEYALGRCVNKLSLREWQSAEKYL